MCIRDSSVDVCEDGSVVVVGAPNAQKDGLSTGAIYLFQELSGDTWHILGPVLPKADDFGKQFGRGVAISHGTVVAGAPGEDGQEGVAYTLEKNPEGYPAGSWSTAAFRPLPAPADADLRFGASVAVHGDVIAVGAPRPGAPPKSGEVHVYVPRSARTARRWSQVEDYVVGPGGSGQPSFGSAVALRRATLAVGATDSNTVWVVEPKAAHAVQSWSPTNVVAHELTVAASEGLGTSVALGESLVAVVSRDGKLYYALRSSDDVTSWDALTQVQGEGWVGVAQSRQLLVVGQPGQSQVVAMDRPTTGLTTPELLMRDNLQDKGLKSSEGALYESPDILPSTEQLADPGVALGGGNWDKTLHEDVRGGQDNYVYLRVANIGVVSTTAKAHLYSSEPSSFLDPRRWDHVGTLDLGTLEPGERAVRGPVIWAKGAIAKVTGGAGGAPIHRCFICYVTWPGQAAYLDPMTMKSKSFGSADEFYRYVALHSNICFHNVNIVPATAGVELRRFKVVGLPGSAGQYRLQLKTDLPEGTHVLVDYENERRKVTIDGEGLAVIGDRLALAAGQMEDVQFTVSPQPRDGCWILFQQFHGEALLGAVRFELEAQGRGGA